MPARSPSRNGDGACADRCAEVDRGVERADEPHLACVERDALPDHVERASPEAKAADGESCEIGPRKATSPPSSASRPRPRTKIFDGAAMTRSSTRSPTARRGHRCDPRLDPSRLRRTCGGGASA